MKWFQIHQMLRVIVSLLALSAWPAADADSEQPAVEKPLHYEAVIDAVANRSNKAPILVSVRFKGRYPVFFDDYDYLKQKRVRRAVQILVESSGEDLWPHLIKHADDDRYAFTCCRAAEDDYWFNRTVGKECLLIARQCIDWPCRKHLPRRPAIKSIPELWDSHGGLAAWAEKQQGKLLYELQLEQCQYVVDHSTELKWGDVDAEQTWLGHVREQITELKMTRIPLVRMKYPGATGILTAERVKDYRSRYGAMAKEQIGKPGDK